MQIRIGDLRHRLTLEVAARTDDDSGGAIETWMPAAEVWAGVRPNSGSERELADRIAGRVTHEVWIRYRTDVKPDMRFTAVGRFFEIRAVIDVDERRRLLKCLCEEREL